MLFCSSRVNGILLLHSLTQKLDVLFVKTDYFAKHMGDYEGVLASLETLNLSILKAMDFTKKVNLE